MFPWIWNRITWKCSLWPLRNLLCNLPHLIVYPSLQPFHFGFNIPLHFSYHCFITSLHLLYHPLHHFLNIGLIHLRLWLRLSLVWLVRLALWLEWWSIVGRGKLIVCGLILLVHLGLWLTP